MKEEVQRYASADVYRCACFAIWYNSYGKACMIKRGKAYGG